MPTSSQQEQPQTSQPKFVTTLGQPTSTRTLKAYRPAASRKPAAQSGKKSSTPRSTASKTAKSRSTASSRHPTPCPATAQSSEVSQFIASHTTTTQAVLERPILRCPKFPLNMDPVEADSMSFVQFSSRGPKILCIVFDILESVANFWDILIGLFSVMMTLIVLVLFNILEIEKRIQSHPAAPQQPSPSHPAAQLRHQSSVPDPVVASASYLSSRPVESRHTALRTAASRSKVIWNVPNEVRSRM